ncbi:MAG TPA: M23 family metallopeptidase [Gemmatimonadaceae bacterium]|nr:M23 family metallopeptidase [Gemmatimonadaceae bacterium]
MKSLVRFSGAVALAALSACGRNPPPSGLSPKMSDAEYLKAERMMVPVAGTKPDRLQNTFDGRRGDAGEREHLAIDILAPKGTPVLAAVEGEILRVTTNELGGKTVYATDKTHRFVYYYAHLDRYAGRTKVGAQVKQGTVLGYVGTTGNAPKNIPHLHFQVMRMIPGRQWWTGPPVNPYGLFARAGAAE